MARPANLKLALLLGLVLIGHALGLEWLARQREALVAMPLMTPPMYTRMLQPVAPPPVVVAAKPPPSVPVRKHAVAPRPKPAASAAEVVATPEPLAVEAPREVPVEAPREVPVVEAPATATEVPVVAAPAAAPEAPVVVAPAAAPEPAAVAAAELPAAAASAPAAPSLDTWPTDTRLTYQLGGEYRGGPLLGDARVTWQRQAEKYQVRLDAAVKVLGRTVVSQTLASEGDVTPRGLMPRAYEETRPGKRRAAQFGVDTLQLENGKTAPRPAGLQDTASQFVELAHRFATGRQKLEVGEIVTFWLARPASVDEWTYDVVAREVVQTPNLGDVEAFHLKPRPIANPRGNITAEMWFAPSLQYLPVRIKVVMGTEAYLDLVVDRIDQR